MSGPPTNRTLCFPDWAHKNATLVTGFGGSGMVIADASYARKNTRDDIRDVKDKVMQVDRKVDELDGKVAALDGKVAALDGKVAALDVKFDELRTEQEATQTLVLTCAVKTMKAIDGDKMELAKFISKAEKALRCAELGDDCEEGVAK